MKRKQIVPAVPMTDDRKADVLRRLERIEGQIRGVKRMVEEERPCVEVLTQISAGHEALRGVVRVMMRNYLETCATHAIRKNHEGVYDELMDVIFKFAK